MSTDQAHQHPAIGTGSSRRESTATWALIMPTLTATLALLASCAGPPSSHAGTQSHATAGGDPREAVSCARPEFLGPPRVLSNPPFATTLSPDPIPIPAWITSSGDRVTGNEAFFDSPKPSPLFDNRGTLALLSFTVDITQPESWQPHHSLMLEAFSEDDGVVTATLICAEHDPDVLAAMRASGREPLPDQVDPGRRVSGWIAFRVPRDVTALNLLMSRQWHTGYVAGEYPLFKRPATVAAATTR